MFGGIFLSACMQVFAGWTLSCCVLFVCLLFSPSPPVACPSHYLPWCAKRLYLDGCLIFVSLCLCVSFSSVSCLPQRSMIETSGSSPWRTCCAGSPEKTTKSSNTSSPTWTSECYYFAASHTTLFFSLHRGLNCRAVEVFSKPFTVQILLRLSFIFGGTELFKI